MHSGDKGEALPGASWPPLDRRTGKVFWADLSLGLARILRICDLRTGNSVVEFIALPRGYEIRPGEEDEFTVVPKMRRPDHGLH